MNLITFIQQSILNQEQNQLQLRYLFLTPSTQKQNLPHLPSEVWHEILIENTICKCVNVGGDTTIYTSKKFVCIRHYLGFTSIRAVCRLWFGIVSSSGYFLPEFYKIKTEKDYTSAIANGFLKNVSRMHAPVPIERKYFSISEFPALQEIIIQFGYKHLSLNNITSILDKILSTEINKVIIVIKLFEVSTVVNQISLFFLSKIDSKETTKPPLNVELHLDCKIEWNSKSQKLFTEEDVKRVIPQLKLLKNISLQAPHLTNIVFLFSSCMCDIRACHDEFIALGEHLYSQNKTLSTKLTVKFLNDTHISFENNQPTYHDRWKFQDFLVAYPNPNPKPDDPSPECCRANVIKIFEAPPRFEEHGRKTCVRKNHWFQAYLKLAQEDFKEATTVAQQRQLVRYLAKVNMIHKVNCGITDPYLVFDSGFITKDDATEYQELVREVAQYVAAGIEEEDSSTTLRSLMLDLIFKIMNAENFSLDIACLKQFCTKKTLLIDTYSLPSSFIHSKVYKLWMKQATSDEPPPHLVFRCKNIPISDHTFDSSLDPYIPRAPFPFLAGLQFDSRCRGRLSTKVIRKFIDDYRDYLFAQQTDFFSMEWTSQEDRQMAIHTITELNATNFMVPHSSKSALRNTWTDYVFKANNSLLNEEIPGNDEAIVFFNQVYPSEPDIFNFYDLLIVVLFLIHQIYNTTEQEVIDKNRKKIIEVLQLAAQKGRTASELILDMIVGYLESIFVKNNELKEEVAKGLTVCIQMSQNREVFIEQRCVKIQERINNLPSLQQSAHMSRDYFFSDKARSIFKKEIGKISQENFQQLIDFYQIYLENFI